MRKKSIVILMDGTSNQITANRTNILRLYGTLKKNAEQVVFYDPGVGTLGAKNGFGLAKARDIGGLIAGKGLFENVEEAYRFIIDNFNYEKPSAVSPGWQDDIYILGFSRGAYSARVLAGLLRAFGVIEKRNLNLLSYIFRAYQRIGSQAAQRDGKTGKFAEINLYRKVLRPFEPAIKFLGLFDTVSSVYKPKSSYFRASGSLRAPLQGYAYVNHNCSVETVRHAVSIHERRVMFRPCLWPEGQMYAVGDVSKPQDLREVWFTGVHSDVGGGEVEAESGLAKIPLLWMIEEAEKAGLHFRRGLVDVLVRGGERLDDKPRYHRPNCMEDMHYMAIPWMPVEFIPAYRPKASSRPRVLGFALSVFDRRVMPENARIHSSVFKRMKMRRDDLKNLPKTWREEG